MTGTVCESSQPTIIRGLWLACGKTDDLTGHQYTCRCGHEKWRTTCPEHAPDPSIPIGCRDCWDDGHECQLVVVDAALN